KFLFQPAHYPIAFHAAGGRHRLLSMFGTYRGINCLCREHVTQIAKNNSTSAVNGNKRKKVVCGNFPQLAEPRLATPPARFARKCNYRLHSRPCAKSVPPSSRPKHVRTLASPSTEQYGDSRSVGLSQAGGV